jgi:hypothetical protein
MQCIESIRQLHTLSHNQFLKISILILELRINLQQLGESDAYRLKLFSIVLVYFNFVRYLTV